MDIDDLHGLLHERILRADRDAAVQMANPPQTASHRPRPWTAQTTEEKAPVAQPAPPRRLPPFKEQESRQTSRRFAAEGTREARPARRQRFLPKT